MQTSHLVGVFAAIVACAACATDSHTAAPTLSVDPPTATVPAGLTEQLTATSIAADGTKTDVTTLVAWHSADDATAIIDDRGVATAMAPGSTTITAELDGATATISLSVSDAVITSLAISGDLTLPLGVRATPIATGTFSDYSMRDVSADATWSSSNTAVATVMLVNHQIQIDALSRGDATITASLGGKSATLHTTVTDAVLQSITVSGPASFPKGTSQQLTATGLFSDQHTSDLTAYATWSSSAPSTLSVSNSIGSVGLAHGALEGTATVTATWNGTSGSAQLGVSAAALTGLTITASQSAVLRGGTLQLHAIGSFTDGISRDISSTAVWSTGNTTVASVSNAAGTSGLVTGLVVGTSSIYAMQDSYGDYEVLDVTPPWFLDSDGDGYGDPAQQSSLAQTSPPAGYTGSSNDCDDASASVNPGATELLCNMTDDDCDMLVDAADPSGVLPTWFRDSDGDGFGDPATSIQACMQPLGYVASNGDCYDANTNAHPGQSTQQSTDRGDGSYDYNCDSVQQSAYGLGHGSVPDSNLTCHCQQGWLAAQQPACGSTATLLEYCQLALVNHGGSQGYVYDCVQNTENLPVTCL